MKSSGKRWVVGIPPEIMEALGLHGGEKTKLHVKGQKIVAEFPSEQARDYFSIILPPTSILK